MTDKQLRDAAVAELKQTTVSGVEYARRLAAGKYPDPLKTRWGKAYNYLDQIGVPPVSVWPPRETDPPPFSPDRVFEVESLAEWSSVYNGIRLGDRINVHAPVKFDWQVSFHARLAGPAEIHFDDDVLFTAATCQRDMNFAWLWAQNLRLFGGTLHDPRQLPNCHGILAYESTDSGWWDFNVTRCGGSAVRTFTPNGNGARLTMVGEVTNWGLDLSLDPHTIQPGSGLHPSYIGGNNPQGFRQTDSMFALTSVDGVTGSNQIGPGVRNRHWYRAKDLMCVPDKQTCGNAVQPFGDVVDARIWVEADNVNKVVEPTWLGAGARNVVVEYGRGGSTARRPPAYVPHTAVTYRDCT